MSMGKPVQRPMRTVILQIESDLWILMILMRPLSQYEKTGPTSPNLVTGEMHVYRTE